MKKNGQIVWSVAILLFSLLSLAGCIGPTSQVPQVSTYKYSDQQKMQAAHHWDVLADDVATRFTKHLSSTPVFGRALSVSSPPEGFATSPFLHAFEDLLITQMVNHGLDVRRDGKNCLDLQFTVQVVSHNDRGYIRAKAGRNTMLALLANGVWAAVNVATNSIATHDALIAGGAIATGVGLDVLTGDITSLPNKEVIINVSLMDGNKYIMRKTGIYYINEPDDYHYKLPVIPELPKMIPVVSE